MSDLRELCGIKALSRAEIESLMGELGEPSYRAKQIVRWLYQRGVESWDEMTDLPAGLRSRLAEKLGLPQARVVDMAVSAEDGTRRFVIELAAGSLVEAVGLPTWDRLTVCFSTQVGCAMGCSFCATGKSGFERDLGPGEMVDQIRLVGDAFKARVTNAVAMGQGEPFANYDSTLAALRFINSPDGLHIGARHITVSTCGVVPGIERFANEREQFTLAVSLHSAVQHTRDALMPAMSRYPLPALKQAIVRYTEASGRRPTLEFALVSGLNDTVTERAALIAFCHGLHAHVNIIPINAVEGTAHEPPSSDAIKAFVQELVSNGIETSVRAEKGADIDAACGQLRRRFTDSSS